MYTLSEIIKGRPKNVDNDINIINSIVQYKPGTSKMDYILFELEMLDRDGRRKHLFKAVKLYRLIKLPDTIKQSVKMMDIHSQMLSSFYESDIKFISILARIEDTGDDSPIGLLQLYGVQGIGETLEQAKRIADEDFAGLTASIQGNYRGMEFKYLTSKEADWLREKMANMKYIQVVRGIPTARKSAAERSAKGFGGQDTDTSSEETSEQFANGLADHDFINMTLSSPINYEVLESWLTQISKKQTYWNSIMQGSTSLSAGINIPVMFAANLGSSMGMSDGVSDSTSEGTSTSHSVSNGQSFSTSESVSNSQSFSTSQSISSSASFSESVGNSQNLSTGENFGVSSNLGTSASIGHSEGTSLGISHGTSTSQSVGNSFGFSESHSVGQSVTNSTGVSNSQSESFGSSQSVGQSSSVGTSQSQSSGSSSSNGSSWGGSSSQNYGISNGINHSSGVNNGVSGGVSAKFGIGVSGNISHGTSDSWGTSSGESYGSSSGNSWGGSSSNSVTNSNSVGMSTSQGVSSSQGTSHSNSFGTTTSQSQSIGQSVSNGTSTSHSSSVSQGVGESFGSSKGQSESDSWSQGVSKGTGKSYGTSLSNGYGTSEGQSLSRGTGSSSSQSQGTSSSHSTGVSKGTSSSESYGEGTSWGRSQGKSSSVSNSISNGMSSSMGVGASLGIGKTYQFIDNEIENIVELLEYQRQRLKSAINGKYGAFFVDMYIATESIEARSAARTAAKFAWGNEQALINPIQILEPEEEENKHLLYHMNAFSPCAKKELDNYGQIESYKYTSILTSSELTAYTHVIRLSDGGLFADLQNIPELAVPSEMTGEIYVGKVVTGYKWTIDKGYLTNFDYRIANDNIMHGLFAAGSRSGKTVAALRFVAELANKIKRKPYNKRMRIIAMDPKYDWRKLSRYVEPERFKLYSMGDPNFFPFKLNPLKVPYGVDAEFHLDTLIDVFCRSYGLGVRSVIILLDTLKTLYQNAGVFETNDLHEISKRSATVTIADAFEFLNKKKENKEFGRDKSDAVDKVLDRLSRYSWKDGILYKLYCQKDGMSIDELLGEDDVVVLESGKIQSNNMQFIFGFITASIYMYAKYYPDNFMGPDQFETCLIVEEANRVLSGEGGGTESGIQGQSIFEEMLDQAAGLGLFVFSITQKPSMMPSSILANSGLIWAGRMSISDDIDVMMSILGKDGKIDDRIIKKFFPLTPTGWFICKQSRTFDYKDSAPVMVAVDRLDVDKVTNDELSDMMYMRQIAKQTKQVDQLIQENILHNQYPNKDMNNSYNPYDFNNMNMYNQNTIGYNDFNNNLNNLNDNQNYQNNDIFDKF